MNFKKTVLTAALLAAMTAGALAQSTTSPYSRIGYGILADGATATQRQMGGVGYAMPGGRQVNFMNPASYSMTDSLTFLWDIGVDFSNLWSKEDGESGYNFGGGLDNINAAFRIAPHLGASFGVVPFSNVGYSFGGTISGGSESRGGTGSINELYVGAGWEPFGGFSIGANVSYLFGTVTNTTVISSTTTNYFNRNLEVRDWNLHVGLQWHKVLSKHDVVAVGVTYSPKKSLHGHTWGDYYDDNSSSSPDTVGYTSLKGKYETPHTVGAGINFVHSNVMAEVDFTYQNWADAKYTTLEGFESPNVTFDDRWKVAAGMQWIPDSRGSYARRITYRAGAYYNHDYQNILGNNVRDYGITAGVGLPALGSKTLVNLGFEWKHRYASPQQLVSENYLNITLSVTFNELWFWKNRIR